LGFGRRCPKTNEAAAANFSLSDVKSFAKPLQEKDGSMCLIIYGPVRWDVATKLLVLCASEMPRKNRGRMKKILLMSNALKPWFQEG